MEWIALNTPADSVLTGGCARRLPQDGFDVAVSSSSGAGEELGEELGGLRSSSNAVN